MFFQILEENIKAQPVDKLYNYVSQELQKNLYIENFSYTAVILVIIGVVLFIRCRNKDREVGIKGAGISSFLTNLTKILLVSLIIFLWLFNCDMSIYIQILILGLPLSLIFAANSKGLFDAIKLFFLGLLFGVILLISVQIFRIFGLIGLNNNIIFLAEKVLSTIIAVLSLTVVGDYAFKGWMRGSIPISKNKKRVSSNNYSSSYSSGYSNYSSDNTNSNPDIFGVDTRVEYNYFTGKNEYYQNGRLVATGDKSPFSGNENIYDTNGHKILTKEQGVFGDYVYKDNNYNTVYKENNDFIFGSSVYDNNYNKVAESDPFADLLGTGRKYTSKK